MTNLNALVPAPCPLKGVIKQQIMSKSPLGDLGANLKDRRDKTEINVETAYRPSLYNNNIN